MNAQKGEFEKTYEKVCDENESRRIKKQRVPKIFLMEGRVYKARAVNSCHGYQTTSGQRFFIH